MLLLFPGDNQEPGKEPRNKNSEEEQRENEEEDEPFTGFDDQPTETLSKPRYDLRTRSKN